MPCSYSRVSKATLRKNLVGHLFISSSKPFITVNMWTMMNCGARTRAPNILTLNDPKCYNKLRPRWPECAGWPKDPKWPSVSGALHIACIASKTIQIIRLQKCILQHYKTISNNVWCCGVTMCCAGECMILFRSPSVYLDSFRTPHCIAYTSWFAMAQQLRLENWRMKSRRRKKKEYMNPPSTRHITCTAHTGIDVNA